MATLIAKGHNSSTAATQITVTLDASVSPGDFIYVDCVYFGAADFALSDQLGNTYSLIARVDLTGDGDSTSKFGCQVTTGGTPAILCNENAGVTTEIGAVAAAWTGMAAGTLLDVSTTGHGTSTTPSAGPTSTTAAANRLVVVSVGETLSGSTTYTAGAGFAIADQWNNASNLSGAIQWKVVSSIGTQTGSLTGSASAEWGTVIAAFAITGGGGGGTKLRRNSDLNGLGAAGPFFHDPLAA